MSIGVAIIGGGIFAREEHLPAIKAASQHLTLKAVYSRSLKSAKTVGGDIEGVELYSDDSGDGKSYEDLLKRGDVQGVILALPIMNQPDYIRKALSAGKHVLAEKPIAKDVATGKELIKWYHDNIDTSKIFFGIAENFRFLPSFVYGAEQVSQLGRVLNFRHRLMTLVTPGEKYFETPWRKVPEYQGGFLLDGGVHHVAGLRLLLGNQNAPKTVSAFSTLLQEHLPPVDTINAVWQTQSGVSGIFSASFGTKYGGGGGGGDNEFVVSCENGSVTIGRGFVSVARDGKDSKEEFSNEGSGVTPEVKAWAESLAAGKADPRQSPEEALKDVQLIEAMLRSGESNGAPVQIT